MKKFSKGLSLHIEDIHIDDIENDDYISIKTAFTATIRKDDIFEILKKSGII